MNNKGTKEFINKFASQQNKRDVKEGKINGKNRKEIIFEELNTLVAYTKRLEFQLKECIDIPLKMFKILKLQSKSNNKNSSNSSNSNTNNSSTFLNEDLKKDDFNKIMKYAHSFGVSSFDLVEYQLLPINLNEFLHVASILDGQKLLQKEFKELPLIREGIEEIYPFDTAEFKEFLEKAKKMHSKLR